MRVSGKFNRLSILAGVFLCCAISAFGDQLFVVGITVVRPAPSCPLFITNVDKHSPAHQAGVLAGDRVVSIDGVAATGFSELKLLRGNSAKPVVLEVLRGGARKRFGISRVPQSVLFKKSHLQSIDGEWVPKGTTKEDLEYQKRLEALLDNRQNLAGTAFGFGHYPKDLTLYYPGFEVFVTRDPGPMVGGIERGPALHAGMKWGDVLLSVDGTPASGLDQEAIERLLSSIKPRRVSILVQRVSTTKRFTFQLERADRILARSGWQVIRGEKFPAVIHPTELQCAFQGSTEH
jgi:C-terminal processing protease CtpA/Prc